MATNVWSDGDFQVDANELLDAHVRLAVAERTALPNHPAIAAGYLGNVRGMGAQTIVSKLSDLGAGVADPVSETGAVIPSKLTYTDVSCTVAQKSKARSASDLKRYLDPTGTVLRPDLLAFDAVGIRNNTMLELVAEAASTFTEVSGSTGTALTWAKIFAARDALAEAGVDVSQLICLLADKQWSDLQNDMSVTITNDAMTRSEEAQALLRTVSRGHKGTFFDITIYTTDRVPYANGTTDRAGSLFAPLGVVWGDMTLDADPHGFIELYDGGKLQIEYEREASRRLKNAYYNFGYGASRGDNTRGVKLLSRAS